MSALLDARSHEGFGSAIDLNAEVFEPYEFMEIPSQELGPIACDTKSVGVESRKTEPEVTLLCLPHDCLVSILTRLAGSPPEQASSLALISRCCHQLMTLAEVSAEALVSKHLNLARAELATLDLAGISATELDGAVLPSFDFGAPLVTARTWCFALWGQMPILPLQFTLLRNSVTEELDLGGRLPLPWHGLGLDGIAVKGTLRITWPLPPPGEQTAADYVRAVRLGQSPSLVLALAAGLGLLLHPGLFDRWRIVSRRCSICPSCKRYRRLDYDEHSRWAPTTFDTSLQPLPKALVQCQSAYCERLRVRSSCARDAEEFEACDLDDMVQALSVSSALKCTCESGGDLCRYIGVPPVRAQPRRPPATGGTTASDPMDNL